MKILLVNYADKNMKITEPLGICYLASALRRKGYEVDLLDSRVKEYDLDEFATYICIISKEYSIIGISTSQYFGQLVSDSPASIIISRLRSVDYKGHITLGGYGPSLDWETYIRLGADSVSIGEGEIIICNLADAIRDGKDWRMLKGMVYINAVNSIIRNENEKIVPFDEIDFPARDILYAFAEKYGFIHLNPSVQGSRGCYMSCAYCSTPEFMRNQGGPVYRMRSIKRIVDEIEELYKNGFINFDFIDDNFLPPDKKKAKERAIELRDEMVKRNISMKFFMEFRLEYIDTELLEILKEAGLRRVFIGIESFNEEDLRLYNRTYSVEKVCKAIEEVLAAGFSPMLNSEYRFRYGFININPLSTIKSLRNTGEYFKKYHFTYKKLCKKLYLYDNNSKILTNVLKEYPEYSNDNYFKDKRIAAFYHFYSQYNQKYVKYRNKGRNYEKKIMKEINVGSASNEYLLLIKALEEMRYELDEDIYDIYMGALDIAEQDNYVEKLETFFEFNMSKFQEKEVKMKEILKRASMVIGEQYGDVEKFYA